MQIQYSIFLDRLHENKVMQMLSSFFLSISFPLLSALYSFYCYLNYDPLAVIAYIAVVGSISVLLMKNTTPVLSVLFLGYSLFFFNVSAIKDNNTVAYYRENLLPILVCIAVFALSALIRILLTPKKVNRSILSVAVFAITILFNGIGSDAYITKSTYFSLGIVALLLLSSFLFYSSVSRAVDIATQIGYAAIGLSVLLLLIMAKSYVTMSQTEGFALTMEFLRTHYYLGIGNRNSFGVAFAFCVPCILYLCLKKKYHFIYYLFAMLSTCGAILSTSRQAAVVSVISFFICCVILIRKSECGFCISMYTGVITLLLLALGLKYYDRIANDILRYFCFYDPETSEFTVSGRVELWRKAIIAFLNNPIFGEGFFGYCESESIAPSVLPSFYHNTVLQTFASCGVIGGIPYLLHRVRFFICFSKNRSPERIFLFITLISILAVSLVDIHFYDYLPTLLYGALFGILAATEKEKDFDD